MFKFSEEYKEVNKGIVKNMGIANRADMIYSNACKYISDMKRVISNIYVIMKETDEDSDGELLMAAIKLCCSFCYMKDISYHVHTTFTPQNTKMEEYRMVVEQLETKMNEFATRADDFKSYQTLCKPTYYLYIDGVRHNAKERGDDDLFCIDENLKDIKTQINTLMQLMSKPCITKNPMKTLKIAEYILALKHDEELINHIFEAILDTYSTSCDCGIKYDYHNDIAYLEKYAESVRERVLSFRERVANLEHASEEEIEETASSCMSITF